MSISLPSSLLPPVASYPEIAAMLAASSALHGLAVDLAKAADAAPVMGAALPPIQATLASGIAAIDQYGSRYRAPNPSWLQWEATARLGMQLVGALHVGRDAPVPPAALHQISDAARAGALLLAAWTG